MFLEDMRRKHRELALLVKRIVEIKRVAYDVKGGRTIGLVVPDEIRERLEHMRISHHIRSYRHTVLVAVRLGLVELERVGASPAVESLRPGRRDPDRSVLDTEPPPPMFPDRPHPVSVAATTLPVGSRPTLPAPAPEEESGPFPTTERGVELEEGKQKAELADPDDGLEGWERDDLDPPKEKPEDGLDFGSLDWNGPDRDRDR